MLFVVGESLNWVWNLPQGQRLSARFDPDTHTESVFLEKRLVSRATPQGKKEVHVIPLGESGAYRGAAEAHVKFDTTVAKRAQATCTVDDHLIPPAQLPPVAKVAATSSVIVMILFLIIRFGVMALFPRHRPVPTADFHPPFTVSHLGVIGEADAVTRLQRWLDGCWRPKIAGRVVIEVELASYGRPISSRVAEHGTLPPQVEQCISNAAGQFNYDGSLANPLQFTVELRP